MPTALVTGATGFIGPHVVRALRAGGWDVACLVRRPERARPLAELPVRLVVGDITAPETLPAALAGVDTVIHLAGLTKAFRAREYDRVNVGGTRHLLAACARLPVPPVTVVVSSLAAAGPAPPDRPRRESDPPRPVSAYGRSKLAGEQAALEFAGQVPLTVVRPPIVFGEGDRDVLRMFSPIARYGLHPVPTRAQYRYSLIHADELAEALCLAAARGQRAPGSAAGSAGRSNGAPNAAAAEAMTGQGSGIYFVAHHEQPTYVELGRLIAAAVERPRLRVIRAPQVLTWALGLLGECVGRLRGEPLIVNLDKARESTAGSWTCDAGQAAGELGYEPRQSLAARLRQTADWYRAAGWL